MNNGTRDIDEVLYFRSDISPFLVHLTKDKSTTQSKEILKSIIEQKQLIAGQSSISYAHYGLDNLTEEKKHFFQAISFTETPLNEIYCLMEIDKRQINLQPYGLVFVKDRLIEKGVSPALYFNNHNPGDKDKVFEALCSLIDTHEEAAKRILPLVSAFGYYINRPTKSTKSTTKIDFTWEREWRFPNNDGKFKFEKEDIFIGLCPHEEIETFEELLPDVKFIDPMRNVKWYANKLVEARKRCDIKYSVV